MDQRVWVTLWVAFVGLMAFNLGQICASSTLLRKIDGWGLVWSGLALGIGAFHVLKAVWRPKTTT
jgi:hypothetical protein